MPLVRQSVAQVPPQAVSRYDWFSGLEQGNGDETGGHCSNCDIISSVSTECTSASVTMGVDGAWSWGQRDKASELLFSFPDRYLMVIFLMPLPNTLLHQRVCFPVKLGVSNTALTAEWSVRTWTL